MKVNSNDKYKQRAVIKLIQRMWQLICNYYCTTHNDIGNKCVYDKNSKKF